MKEKLLAFFLTHFSEEEGDFVLPENFGAEEIYQNKQQNFGFEEQEVLNDATIQDPNFGINELGPMGWQPLVQKSTKERTKEKKRKESIKNETRTKEKPEKEKTTKLL